MKIEELTQPVYLIGDNYQIEETTYGQYLRDYGADETTSPNGIAPRIHIRQIEHAPSDGNYCISYEIWSWGVSGNHPRYTGTSFDTEEEAQMHLFDVFESNIANGKGDTTSCYYSKEEVMESIADMRNKPINVIRRYVQYCEFIRAQDAQVRIQTQEADRLYKIELKERVKAEVDTIMKDEQFTLDIASVYAAEITGPEKSLMLAHAFTQLPRISGKFSDWLRSSRIIVI